MLYIVLVLCCGCVLLWWWWWWLLVVFMYCRTVLAAICCNGCWPIRENLKFLYDRCPSHQILCDKQASHKKLDYTIWKFVQQVPVAPNFVRQIICHTKKSNYTKVRLFSGSHNLGQIHPIFFWYNIPFWNLQRNESNPKFFFRVSLMTKQKICLKLCMIGSCYDSFSKINIKCRICTLYDFVVCNHICYVFFIYFLSLMDSVVLQLCYDGWWETLADECMECVNGNNTAFLIRQDCMFDKFLARIYDVLQINRNEHNITMKTTLRSSNTVYRTCLLPMGIFNDEIVKVVLHMASDVVNYGCTTSRARWRHGIILCDRHIIKQKKFNILYTSTIFLCDTHPIAQKIVQKYRACAIVAQKHSMCAKYMLCVFVRWASVAQVFVQWAGRHTKAQPIARESHAMAWPSHQIWCDGLCLLRETRARWVVLVARWLLQIPFNGQQQPSNTHQQHPTLPSRLQHTNPPPPSTTANNQTITTSPTQHHNNNNKAQQHHKITTQIKKK